MFLPKKHADNVDENTGRMPVFDENQVEELFKARCMDLRIESKDKQFKKFEAKLSELSYNRRCNLTNMLISTETAVLLARWMMTGAIDITHLILSKNALGDEGL